MGLFSAAKLFGMTIRESANDGSDFTNPDADYRRLFLGEDGFLHVKDSAGAVSDPYDVSGAGLASGTSNPGSPSDGDLFYRTDLDQLIRYRSSGTRWVTCTQYRADPTGIDPDGRYPSGSGTNQTWYFGMVGVDFDVLIEKWYITTNTLVTNNGSNYRTYTLTDSAGASISSFNTSTDTAGTKTNHEQTVNAALGTTSPDDLWLQVVSTLGAGTPGSAYVAQTITYRLIVT